MATMIQGFCTTFGSSGLDTAAIRGLPGESQLWSDGWTGTLGPDTENFGHYLDRVGGPNLARKAFNIAGATHAMFGMEANHLGDGFGTRFSFYGVGVTDVASIWVAGSLIRVELAGATIATYSPPGWSNTTYNTIEFAFGTRVVPPTYVVCETRINGARVAALSTAPASGVTSGGGQADGTMSATIPAVGTPLYGCYVNLGTLGNCHLWYWWQKSHSAIWTSLPTGGAAFIDQSDFNGVKKKFMLVPNALSANAAYQIGGVGNTWTNGALTHPANLADAALDDTGYIANQTDAGGTPAATNRIGHGYTNLPAAATRVGMVQRTVWAKTFQTLNGILARTGIRSAASGDNPVSTDFFDETSTPQNSVSFAGSYSTGVPTGAGTQSASIYYPRQGTLAQYTTAGTDVWSVASVNAIEGLIEMNDIL